jgi:hypothetical protein
LLRFSGPSGQDAIHVEKEGLDGLATICLFLGRRLYPPVSFVVGNRVCFQVT